MYLNERSWEASQEDPYVIDNAVKRFLDIYAAVKRVYPECEIYIPEGEVIYLRPGDYSLGKWLASADIEYRRLYFLFWQRGIRYHPEDEYEMSCDGEPLKGGTEACLNDSFMVSICLDGKWGKEVIEGELYSLADDEEREARVKNVFCKEQLECDYVKEVLRSRGNLNVWSYEELWKRRGELFPHLSFCPSVENDLDSLEKVYLAQILRKLAELECYYVEHGNGRFQPELLTKTTMESKATMEKYEAWHTFTDEGGEAYVASWHMRFTGIPGRIFFIPQYKEVGMLVCYIGRKLPNVTYPT